MNDLAADERMPCETHIIGPETVTKEGKLKLTTLLHNEANGTHVNENNYTS